MQDAPAMLRGMVPGSGAQPTGHVLHAASSKALSKANVLTHCDKMGVYSRVAEATPRRQPKKEALFP